MVAVEELQVKVVVEVLLFQEVGELLDQGVP
jgi:hypothetical protein